MKPLILIILDGFGLRDSSKGNAVKLAKMPNYDSYWKGCPHCTLKAHGEFVGLPSGTLGGSEVGHMNLGAGRVAKQELQIINDSVRDKSFFRNKAFLAAIKNVKKNGSRLHLLGLVSDAGVHSDMSHLFALMKLAHAHKVKDVFIHFFADGRDCPELSALKYLGVLQKKINRYGGRIATVSGRYYSMDRNNNWDRTKKAYEAIAYGVGKTAGSASVAINEAYEAGGTDEFITPAVIGDYFGVQDGDFLINFDYRTDRERQLTRAFVQKDFKHFKKKEVRISFVCMTRYYKTLNLVAFEHPLLKNLFGEVIAKNGIKQLRVAESEKYAHVSYFFNNQLEKPFNGEDRIIVPSPRVATYDLKPEMSIYEVTSKVAEAVKSKKYGVIVLNFANPDMAGHTGNLGAAIKALEHVDLCLGRVVAAARNRGFNIMITADHGNCEEMVGPHKTSHTLNPVPFILLSDKKVKLRNGVLGDVAPTMLALMGIKQPEEMSGKSLII